MFQFFGHLIHLIAVRLGLWDSPSLSSLGLDHRDFDAKVTKDGVVWKEKAKKDTK